MKNKEKNTHSLLKFQSILLLCLFFIGLYSFSQKNITIPEIRLKKTELAKPAKKTSYIKLPKLADFYIPPTPKEPEKPKIDTTLQRILLIGDSMTKGLMYRLNDYCQTNDYKLKTVVWVSSSTKWFAKYDTLSYYLKNFKPTYVIVVIGSNELFIKNIFEKRKKYVVKILSKLDTIPYIWIGPPNWTEDTGINDLLRECVGEGRFFLSKNLKFKRKDIAHPTRKSSAQWMDSIASWIVAKSQNPIKLTYPEQKAKKRPKAILLKPL